MRTDNVDCDVRAVAYRATGAEENQPHKQVARNLLGPGQRVTQKVTGANLQYQDDRDSHHQEAGNLVLEVIQ